MSRLGEGFCLIEAACMASGTCIDGSAIANSVYAVKSTGTWELEGDDLGGRCDDVDRVLASQAHNINKPHSPPA